MFFLLLALFPQKAHLPAAETLRTEETIGGCQRSEVRTEAEFMWGGMLRGGTSCAVKDLQR